MFRDLGFFVLLVGVLIFVHELGHFLVAKAFRVKVVRFSIGFGPKLLGFTKGETEYQISLLPFGGYVKMAGDSPYEDLDPKDAGRGFLAQAPWKRALISFAGPLMNLVFPVLVFFLVFVGAREQIAARVGSIDPGMPAASADLRPGDRILAVDDQPIRSFEDLQGAFRDRYERPVRLLLERDGKTLATDVTPLKRVVSDPIQTRTFGQIGVSPVPKAPVLGVPPGSAAAKAGLRSFDRIVQIDGAPIRDEAELFTAMAKAKDSVRVEVLRSTAADVPGVAVGLPELLTFTVEKQPGEGYAALGAEADDLYVSGVAPDSPAARAGLQVGDRLLAVDGKELTSNLAFLYAGQSGKVLLRWQGAKGIEEREVALEKTTFRDSLGNKAELPDHGLVVGRSLAAEAQEPPKVTVHVGIGEAFGKSLEIVPRAIGQTAKMIAGLFTREVPLDALGGPVMIFRLAGKTAEQGSDSFLELMALLSINLGLMNLLPIPVLDGFQLLSSAWEGVRRRPIPARAREVANLVGLALLVMLMIKVMINDFTR